MTRLAKTLLSLAALVVVSALPAYAGGANGGGTAVPEPGTMLLLASGLGLVIGVRARRKQ